jgi:hypothetical protein
MGDVHFLAYPNLSYSTRRTSLQIKTNVSGSQWLRMAFLSRKYITRLSTRI